MDKKQMTKYYIKAEAIRNINLAFDPGNERTMKH